MNKIVFDCNIFDEISKDESVKNKIHLLVERGIIEVIIPRTVRDELIDSPFMGVPNWFPITAIGDSVFIADRSPVDSARLGSGIVFKKHLGSSSKISDAVIADTADTDATIFVSNDNRCRKRLSKISNGCTAHNFTMFKDFLDIEITKLNSGC